ncbi:centromere protein S isoform X2 [Anomaloglossus baeobatrachus]|uniref:centromere protein S isoform X2 n=1 Tax=Anomaloglossus baeobatrachus TaxID=238106 RepID=UPI003F501159
MAENEEQAREQTELKKALHYTVGNICQEVGEDYQVTFSKHAIKTIRDMTYDQCETFAKDLEKFARMPMKLRRVTF